MTDEASPSATQADKRRVVVLLRRLRKAPNAVDDDEVLGRCERAALATALSLRSKLPAAITAIAMGPAKREDRVLAMALRAGCDRAFRVHDHRLDGLDFLGVAEVLAAATRLAGFDVVICGERSQDERQGATGPAVAQLLDVPHVSRVIDLRIIDDRLIATQRAEGMDRQLVCRPPTLLCVNRHAPTLESTDGDYVARRGGSIDLLDPVELGVDPRTLSHRRALLGTARASQPGAESTLVKDPEELIRRLVVDRLLG